ncbi:acetone carboxylase subunit gamma [Paeniglutamicibacter gangotriensis]|uniref:Acetone carboxylase subunit gamma n=2 Tax=Paeniglutamicibacter gangotriensis TaxID=254787 RepID=M7NF07_9MICC|nr:acetone carboxylase subunit gamma [Paeniglutamicibacter gangotriensis]EMR00400.1 acetone carboxylase subunit gamma [Paeniglutamicibacter gangotriensis Lz1y]KAA0974212.1 acetone carboxylase subunit gamma [Paeniglutamicibacter gangotriensis]
MRVPMTEYLYIDLSTEQWVCRPCGHNLGDARGSYKEGTLVYDRDPREIHPPIIDPEKYEFTFSPDPAYCRILEYCCPKCGTQMETEYLPPGHPPTIDMIWDIDALRTQWEERGEDPELVVDYGPGENAVTDMRSTHEGHHNHSHR